MATTDILAVRDLGDLAWAALREYDVWPDAIGTVATLGREK